MLHFKVKEMLMASGKKSPMAWLKKFCDFGHGKAFNIINNKQKSINLVDFSKLCEVLNCTPNDLMYWKETPSTKLPATHPCMTQLTPPVKNSDWELIFKKLSPDKVKKLHDLALKEIGEEE